MIPDDKRALFSLQKTYGTSMILEALIESHEAEAKRLLEEGEDGCEETAGEERVIANHLRYARSCLPEGY